jgi:hypothetical protein
MGKSYDGRIADMVAGAPVPLLRDACRTELDHSERHICADKDMAVAAGSDGCVHEIGVAQIVTILSASDDADSCRQYQFSVFHNLLINSVLCRGWWAKFPVVYVLSF